jgi:hypothetical protein
LKGLKKYGALVADNGGFFSISATPDDRWPASEFRHLSSISITDFEVVQSTGPNEGPRSPGAPIVHAGTNQDAAVNSPLQLNGVVTYTSPVAVQWRMYSSPGLVTFDDASKTNAIATFSAPGDYILMLSADDGIHAVAYDAIHITVANGILAQINISSSAANISWTGSGSSFVIEQTTGLSAPQWTPILTTSVANASIPFTNQTSFFRVRK